MGISSVVTPTPRQEISKGRGAQKTGDKYAKGQAASAYIWHPLESNPSVRFWANKIAAVVSVLFFPHLLLLPLPLVAHPRDFVG